DLGSLRFVADPDGRGETLGGIDLEVADAQGIVDTARARQLPTAHRQVQICGVRFNLIER
ncbi:MAG: hypothetical protein Q7U75_09435, partial [Desulfobacterales bacterium]|nr:hypothetical protein [Desulfobacterales bacterium]